MGKSLVHCFRIARVVCAKGFRLCRLKTENLRTEDFLNSFFMSCFGSKVVIPQVMRCATVFEVRVSVHLGTLGLTPSCWGSWGVLGDAI